MLVTERVSIVLKTAKNIWKAHSNRLRWCPAPEMMTASYNRFIYNRMNIPTLDLIVEEFECIPFHRRDKADCCEDISVFRSIKVHKSGNDFPFIGSIEHSLVRDQFPLASACEVEGSRASRKQSIGKTISGRRAQHISKYHNFKAIWWISVWMLCMQFSVSFRPHAVNAGRQWFSIKGL